MFPLDRHAERWVVHHRVGWLNPLFQALSWIGTWGLVWIAIAAVLAYLWRRPSLVVLVAAADAVAQLVAYGMKLGIGEQRPAFRYAEPKPLVHVPHDGSFPSGHASSSFACATVLAVAAPRAAPALYLLAAAIAFSRVYVGVHYPWDVLAGALLGVALATGLLLLAASLRRSRRAPRGG